MLRLQRVNDALAGTVKPRRGPDKAISSAGGGPIGWQISLAWTDRGSEGLRQRVVWKSHHEPPTANVKTTLRVRLIAAFRLRLAFALCYKVLSGAQPPSRSHAHAIDNLRFIRDAMSRATSSPRSPAGAASLMGVTAIATAVRRPAPPDDRSQGVDLVVAEAAARHVPIALVTMTRKARRMQARSLAAPAHRFALAYVPPLVAGVVLTSVFTTQAFIPSAGMLAAALRRRDFHRRRALDPRRAGAGAAVHGARRRGVRIPGFVGRLLHGRRLRRSAHHIRSHHCEVVWWLERYGSRKSAVRSQQQSEGESEKASHEPDANWIASSTSACGWPSSARWR